MAGRDRFGLILPACLGVTTFVGCVARDEVGETQADSETSPESTSTSSSSSGTTGVSPTTQNPTTIDPTDTTIDPTDTTIDPTTTTIDPTTATGEDTTAGPVELPDCAAIGYVAECEDEDFCAWV